MATAPNGSLLETTETTKTPKNSQHPKWTEQVHKPKILIQKKKLQLSRLNEKRWKC